MASLLPWRFFLCGWLWSAGAAALMGAAAAELPGDRMLATYFADETRRVNTQTFATKVIVSS